MTNILVAYDAERAIGRGNELLWQSGEMRADMARFRELTVGEVVIMGRKTLDSIGMALPRRQNIVITRQQDFHVEGVDVAHSVDEALSLAQTGKEVFVIGGQQIYEQALHYVDRIYATEVGARFEGADAHFPELPQGAWEEISRASFVADDSNKYSFEFVSYGRTI